MPHQRSNSATAVPHHTVHIADRVAHLSWRSVGDEVTIDHQNAVVTVECLAPVVTAHEQCLPDLCLLAHHIKQMSPRRWVNGAVRLIQQQDVALLDQCSGKQNPLLLTTGELVETSGFHPSHADEIEQLFDGTSLFGLSSGGLAEFHHLLDGDRKTPVDCCLLGHECNGSLAHDASFATGQTALQQVQQGRFPCSIRSNQGRQRAWFQLEGDAVDGKLLSITKAELAGRQHRIAGGYRKAQDALVVDLLTGVPDGDRTG